MAAISPTRPEERAMSSSAALVIASRCYCPEFAACSPSLSWSSSSRLSDAFPIIRFMVSAVKSRTAIDSDAFRSAMTQGLGIALLGGEPVPSRCLGVVLRHALTRRGTLRRDCPGPKDCPVRLPARAASALWRSPRLDTAHRHCRQARRQSDRPMRRTAQLQRAGSPRIDLTETPSLRTPLSPPSHR
jgi:hypothetical protein